MEIVLNTGKKSKMPNVRRKKELIFYSLMMVIPVIQVAIFYFIVNFNSLLMSFEEYSYGLREGEKAGYSLFYFDESTASYTLVAFRNFIKCFNELRSESLVYAFKNSMIAFGLQTLLMPWLAMTFSYYIYKNRFGGKVFNVFLFLPSIISPLVITIIYQVLLNDAIPAYMLKIFGVNVGHIFTKNTMVSVFVYYVLTSFGTSVLLYSGAMAGIDTSVMEAADLDGAVGIKGFIYVVFPLVYPTFVTFITVGFATIFTNQLHLFSFLGSPDKSSYYTYGYFLYLKTATGTSSDYPYLSALGITFTLIAVPITFGARYILNKIGPSDN